MAAILKQIIKYILYIVLKIRHTWKFDFTQRQTCIMNLITITFFSIRSYAFSWLNTYKRTGQRKIIIKIVTNWFLEILITVRKERTSFTPRIKQSTRTALRGSG